MKIRYQANRGFSLVELMIAMTILSVLVALCVNFLQVSWRTHNAAKMDAVLKNELQTGVIRMSKGINQAKLIVGNDALGNAYRAKISLADSPPAIASSTLPTIRTTGSLALEKTCNAHPENFFRANSVGNSFLYVQSIGQFSDFGAGIDYMIDLYEFRYIYITDDSHLPDSQRLNIIKSNQAYPSQRLIEWRSIRFASQEQIENAPAADRPDIRTALVSAGIDRAWSRAALTANTAFFNVATGTSAGAGFMIPKSRHFNTLMLPSSSDIKYSVAYNQTRAGNGGITMPMNLPVPAFYNPTVTACPDEAKEVIPANNSTPPLSSGAFPRGFEVMVVGPSSGRSVLLHVSAVGQGSHNAFVQKSYLHTVYARDL